MASMPWRGPTSAATATKKVLRSASSIRRSRPPASRPTRTRRPRSRNTTLMSSGPEKTSSSRGRTRPTTRLAPISDIEHLTRHSLQPRPNSRSRGRVTSRTTSHSRPSTAVGQLRGATQPTGLRPSRSRAATRPETRARSRQVHMRIRRLSRSSIRRICCSSTSKAPIGRTRACRMAGACVARCWTLARPAP